MMSREGSPLSHLALNLAVFPQHSLFKLWHLGNLSLQRFWSHHCSSELCIQAHREVSTAAWISEGAKFHNSSCRNDSSSWLWEAAGAEHTLAAGSQGRTPFQPLSHLPRRHIWISPLSYSKNSCKYDQKYLILLTASAV